MSPPASPGGGDDSLPTPADDTDAQGGAPGLPSFRHVENARARRAKECAQELELLAGRYPELARHLKRPIREVMKEARRTPESDRDRVLAALEASCHTFAEIIERTKLPYQTVYKIVHQRPLVELVEFRTAAPLPEPGRGGRRRPQVLIFLRHTRP